MTTEFERRRPDDAALRWVAGQFGPSADVLAWRRMTGGIASAVHLLTVSNNGRRLIVVLRQHEDRQWRSLVEQEASALEQLDGTDIPAPELVAADPDGTESGHPSILMTRVPGHIHLSPRDSDDWVRQMAATAAEIHELPIRAPEFERWVKPEQASAPGNSSDPELWTHLFELLRRPAPAAKYVFVHRDFQHFNLHWSRERLTGIVDWTFASSGPREVDVGHCRLNLAVLFDADWAQRFRLAYEAESGHALDPWWDLLALATYSEYMSTSIPTQVAGRRSVDTTGMTNRVEHLIRACLERM